MNQVFSNYVEKNVFTGNTCVSKIKFSTGNELTYTERIQNVKNYLRTGNEPRDWEYPQYTA